MKAAQLTSKTGDIVGGCVLEKGDDGDLICLSKQGQAIRMKLSDIPSRGRATQGVIVMRLKAKDQVATMSVVMDDAEGKEAVLEAAEEERDEEVELIKQEERRVKLAASRGKKSTAKKTPAKPASAKAPAGKKAPAKKAKTTTKK